jgi:hypothetical protein
MTAAGTGEARNVAPAAVIGVNAYLMVNPSLSAFCRYQVRIEMSSITAAGSASKWLISRSAPSSAGGVSV